MELVEDGFYVARMKDGGKWEVVRWMKSHPKAVWLAGNEVEDTLEDYEIHSRVKMPSNGGDRLRVRPKRT